jgi:hypothetical protein
VERLRTLLIASPVIHCDETGGRVVGELRWVHVASTDRLTLLTVHARRGIEGMDAAGVLPFYKGVPVHDGWGLTPTTAPPSMPSAALTSCASSTGRPIPISGTSGGPPTWLQSCAAPCMP